MTLGASVRVFIRSLLLWISTAHLWAFAVVSPAASQTFTEFSLPRISGPIRIITGPDGNLWFTEQNGNRVGRITPDGNITEWPTNTLNSRPWGLTVGPDKAIWFAEQGQRKIGRIPTTATAENAGMHEFTIPWVPFDITAADGALWITHDSSVARMLTTGEVTNNFAVANVTRHITTGPDNTLWITSLQAISRMTIDPPTAGAVSTYKPSSPGENPWMAVEGPNGNMWFTEHTKIGRITPRGERSEFNPPKNSLPKGITVGPDGNIWYANAATLVPPRSSNPGSTIGRVTLNGEVTEFKIPTTGGGPEGITSGPDGNIWFTEFNAGKIGRFVPPKN